MHRTLSTNKRAGILISLTAYAAAFGVAAAAAAAAGLRHPLLTVAIGDAAATATIFVASVACDNSSLYDPYWSLQPAAVAAYYLYFGAPHAGVRGLLVATLVFLYSARLTSNFYRDWPGLAKEDFRYAQLRRRFGRLYWPVSLAGVHLFPTMIVYLGCVPLYAAMAARGAQAPLGWLDAAGTVVTLGSIVLAFAADEQLRRFRHDPSNAGKSIRAGLWRLSRHPNYLGEICTWWGLYLFALSTGARWWWTGFGAAAVTGLFVFVSVPIMERRALATRESYAEYRRRTPVLLPVPLTRGR